MASIDNDWLAPLEPEFKKPYYRKLYDSVRNAYRTEQVYPPADEIFAAFHRTPLHNVKAVIIGQDPYHEPGQAEGLCFSVKPGVQIPPSLVNIYQELHDDIGFRIPNNGCLEKWADEGVFLLNSVLTVQAHRAFSHKDFGWQEFTDAAIRILDKQDRPIVFLLWGRPAQEKEKLLHPNPNHLVLKAAHPSPLSAYRGFFGCRHFSRTNAFLEAHGVAPIDWQIEDI